VPSVLRYFDAAVVLVVVEVVWLFLFDFRFFFLFFLSSSLVSSSCGDRVRTGLPRRVYRMSSFCFDSAPFEMMISPNVLDALVSDRRIGIHSLPNCIRFLPRCHPWRSIIRCLEFVSIDSSLISGITRTSFVVVLRKLLSSCCSTPLLFLFFFFGRCRRLAVSALFADLLALSC